MSMNVVLLFLFKLILNLFSNSTFLFTCIVFVGLTMTGLSLLPLPLEAEGISFLWPAYFNLLAIQIFVTTQNFTTLSTCTFLERAS